MKKLAFIVVNYNKKISTLNIFDINNYYEEIDFYILDNSTEDGILESNKNFKLPNNIYYMAMGGNVGLSKAYNRGIKVIKNNYKYIGLLDDDTYVPNQYFELVLKNTEKNYEVIVPKMVNKKNKKIGPLSKGKLSAINSCSIFNAKLFNKYKFNEELFMYYVDIDFFKQLNISNKEKYKIIEIVIKQEFSYYGKKFNIDSENAIKRILFDGRKYYKKKRVMILYMKLYFIKEIFLFNKDFKVLKILFLKTSNLGE